MAAEATMANVDDPEVRQEDNVPERVPITPPASVRDSAGFLPIAPGVPATGTGGFITERATPEFIRMIDEQKARAAEIERQQIEDYRFNQMLQQSARTEDALKAIQAQKRFLATRKLGSDYQRAVSTGLPPAQAWAMAASQNLEAFGNRLSDVTSAIHAARPVVAPTWHPPNSQTGAPGYFETGQGTIHVPASPKTTMEEEGKLSDVEKSRLSALDKEEAALKKQFPNPPSETELSFWPPGRVANPQWQQYQSQLADIERRRNQIWLNAQNRTPGTAKSEGPFNSEAAARGAGYKNGDVVTIKGVGKVRLK